MTFPVKMILNLDWFHTYSVEGESDRQQHLIAENIPVDELQFTKGKFIYELEGEAACLAITSFEATGQSYDWNGTTTTTIVGAPTCDNLSQIKVVLEKE